jgi:hypothetical protein
LEEKHEETGVGMRFGEGEDEFEVGESEPMPAIMLMMWFRSSNLSWMGCEALTLELNISMLNSCSNPSREK